MSEDTILFYRLDITRTGTDGNEFITSYYYFSESKAKAHLETYKVKGATYAKLIPLAMWDTFGTTEEIKLPIGGTDRCLIKYT